MFINYGMVGMVSRAIYRSRIDFLLSFPIKIPRKSVVQIITVKFHKDRPVVLE